MTYNPKNIYFLILAVLLFFAGILYTGFFNTRTNVRYMPSNAGADLQSMPPDTTTTWLATVRRKLALQEYHIRYNAEKKTYTCPNRAQNLRASFSPGHFTLQNRTDSIGNNWQVTLVNKGIFANDEPWLMPDSNATVQLTDSCVHFINKNFTEEYTNTTQGVRQNFIINSDPSNTQNISIQIAVDGLLINDLGNNELHFYETNQAGKVSRRMIYNNLRCWDANHTPLTATMQSIDKNNFAISVDVSHATFPVTIDPLTTTADWIQEGDQEGAYLCYCFSPGDVNGDGYSDIITIAEKYDNGQTDEGKAWLYYGSATGLSTTASWTAETNQEGADMFEWGGFSGDFNGDGYSDIVICSKNYDISATNEGVVFVWYGSADGPGDNGTPDNADWIAASGQDNAYIFMGGGIGDVNGDGYSDLAAGFFGYAETETYEGIVCVWYGSENGPNAGVNGTLTNAEWTVKGEHGKAYLGLNVSSAGDVNGDGYSDIIITQNESDGYNLDALLWYGSSSGLNNGINGDVDNPNWMATCTQEIENLQNNVRAITAGDVNGDGYSDIMMGSRYSANGETKEGIVYLWYGSSSGPNEGVTGTTANADWTAESNDDNASFGYCITPAGDVNGDGYADVLIGSVWYDNMGAAFLWYGSDNGPNKGVNGTPDNADWMVKGDQTSEYYALQVASAGDVNGDGYSDILTGTNCFDTDDYTDAGKIELFYGSAAGPNNDTIGTPDNAAWAVYGGQTSANLGNLMVNYIGDVNGDGYSDYGLTSWLYDSDYQDEGKVYIYYGSETGPGTSADWTFTGGQYNAQISYVASAGDVNGDGYSDVAVCVLYYDNDDINNAGLFLIWYGSSNGLNNGVNGTLSNAQWKLVGSQANADIGRGGGVGDVNGDGYCDVMVNAVNYSSSDHIEEGKAFLWYGSANGLNEGEDGTFDNAAWTVESEQDSAIINSVNSLGDVNGDGYGDIILCSRYYDNGEKDEGIDLIWYGAENGPNDGVNGNPSNADWIIESNQTSGQLGVHPLAVCSGDFNGDGFSDVAAGDGNYYVDDSYSGVVLVWYGSKNGILNGSNGNPSNADWIAYGNTNSGFATSISSGDFNGDGFCDILVGSTGYDAEYTDEGAVFVWYGSGNGLNSGNNGYCSNAGWVAKSAQATGQMGYSSSSVGDVNGDGFCDIVAGAPYYMNTYDNEGAVFLWYGNQQGLRNNLRLYNTDGSDIIDRTNLVSYDFGVGLYAKSFMGRDKGLLQCEVKSQGEAFSTDGTGRSSQTSYTDLGLTGVELQEVVDKPDPASEFAKVVTKVRARVKYNPVTAITGQIYGPWRYMPGYMFGNHEHIVNPMLTPDYWTGTIDTVWEKTGNWSTTVVPTSEINAIIPDQENDPHIDDGVSATAKAMLIDSGAVVTIESGGNLTLASTLENNADTTGLVIHSTADGMGSLIHNTDDVPGTVYRYIGDNAEDWHFLASPVEEQTIADTSNWTPAGSYGDDTGYDLYVWDEPTSCWIYDQNTSVSPTWNEVHPTAHFVQGRGYLYALQDSDVVKTFTGNLGNGTVSYSVTADGTAGTTEDYKGFNLIGNPYPSSIDWTDDDGYSRSMLPLDGSGYDVWIWSTENNNYGVFNSAGSSGTNGVTQYIAPSEGFFILAENGGTFDFNNDARVNANSGAWVKSAVAGSERIEVSVQAKSTEGYGGDEVLLDLGNTANTGGALKLFSQVETAPGLYLPLEDEYYTTRHLTDTVENKTIELGFKAGCEGDYTLTCSYDPSDLSTIYLKDNLTGTIHNFGEEDAYSFSASSGNTASRFVLYFNTCPETLSAEEEINAKVYVSSGNLVIDLSEASHDDEYNMRTCNITGRVIYREPLTGGSLNTYPLPARGVYMISLQSGAVRERYKVVY